MMVHIIDFKESHTKLASRQIHFTLMLAFVPVVGCLIFKNRIGPTFYISISKWFLRCHRLCRLMVMMMSVRCKHILIKWLITLGRIRCLWRETVSILIKMHRHLTFSKTERFFFQTVNFGVVFFLLSSLSLKEKSECDERWNQKMEFIDAGDANALRRNERRKKKFNFPPNFLL